MTIQTRALLMIGTLILTGTVAAQTTDTEVLDFEEASSTQIVGEFGEVLRDYDFDDSGSINSNEATAAVDTLVSNGDISSTETKAVITSYKRGTQFGASDTQPGSSVPMYNGNRRSDYVYMGDEPGEFEDWRTGGQSTVDFQTNTDQGEGTAALELPMYNGRPRSDYIYTGNEPSEFEDWRTGGQSTGDFQDDTDFGEGTAALELDTASDNTASIPRSELSDTELKSLSGETVRTYDTDGSGSLAGTEVLDAMDDLKNGDISTKEARAVVTAFNRELEFSISTPMYNGRPRSDYVYNGDEPRFFDDWQAGELSTSEFQRYTNQGEGTAALEVDTESNDRDVIPRSELSDAELRSEFGDLFREYDSDNSGSLDAGEVSDASSDFIVDGDISRRQMRAVQTAYTRDIEVFGQNSISLSVDDKSTPDTPAGRVEFAVEFDLAPGVSVDSYEVNYGNGNTESFSPGGQIQGDTPVAVNQIYESGTYTVEVTVDLTNGETLRDTVEVSVDPTSPPASTTLELQNGWNLISVPGASVATSASASQIASQCSLGSPNRVTWRYREDAPGSGYTEPDNIRSTAGVWVNVESSCSVELELLPAPLEPTTTQTQDYPAFSEPGFYTVSVSESTSINSVSGSCSFETQSEYGGGTVLELVDGEYQSLRSDTELSPKKGYWVEIESACQMGSDTGSSSPPAP